MGEAFYEEEKFNPETRLKWLNVDFSNVALAGSEKLPTLRKQRANKQLRQKGSILL